MTILYKAYFLSEKQKERSVAETTCEAWYNLKSIGRRLGLWVRNAFIPCILTG